MGRRTRDEKAEVLIDGKRMEGRCLRSLGVAIDNIETEPFSRGWIESSWLQGGVSFMKCMRKATSRMIHVL